MDPALKKSLSLLLTIVFVVVATLMLTQWQAGKPPRISFSLNNQNGELIHSENLAGKPLIVFFGFTHCPDVCPSQMYKISRIIEKLDQHPDLQAIFISVDPERDSPERIKQYLTLYHSSIMGLTGTRAEIKRATKSFNTLLQDAAENPAENYQVAHSSLYYLVNPFGILVKQIPSNISVDEATNLIKNYL